jgi:protocatechuate 3,4-dioxygenase beta subunit
MKKFIYLIFPLLSFHASCQDQASLAQTGKIRVGGGCEGCEAVYESPVSFEKLAHSATLPDYATQGTSLRIYGKVYKADGKTPAPGVVLYVYHTDHTGNYPVKGNEKGWGRRHGYLRGWIRTNENGEYSFLTKRPAPYPGRRDPAHIHCIVKEPGMNEYYIGDFLFDDDPLVSAEEKRSTTIPGGNGVLKTQLINNRLEAQRDIYLGKNVRDYPKVTAAVKLSGLANGSN